MRALVDDLTRQGRQVIVVRAMPELSYDLPVVVARFAQRGKPPPAGPSRAEILADNAHKNLVLDRALGDHVVQLDPTPILCPAEICETVRNGELLYADNDHLSKTGAMLLMPLFLEALARN